MPPEKIEAFVRDSPVYIFDGTSVHARHILIGCKYYASPDQKKQARRKLQEIADQIKQGKLTFEQAAKQYSDCPSKTEGGDLGSFIYSNMTMPFSQAAFALGVAKVSDMVETEFGFHLIEVLDRTEGTGKPGPDAAKIAGAILLGKLREEVLQKALQDNPVTIVK